MAAIRKTSCLTDVGHIVVCEEQHVLGLGHTDILDILLAGASVELAELPGKEGVTHVAARGELLHFERLVRVRVNVLCDRLDGAARRGRNLIGRRKTLLAPDAQHIDQDTVKVGIHNHIIPVVHGLRLAHAAADKFVDGKSCKLL